MTPQANKQIMHNKNSKKIMNLKLKTKSKQQSQAYVTRIDLLFNSKAIFLNISLSFKFVATLNLNPT
jgi:hypothetical protein